MSFNRLEHLRNISGLNCKKNRIGETSKASNGMILTIIDYRLNNDIDVMFEDGYIVKHTRYDHFRSGRIRHKSKIKHSDLPKVRLGEKQLSKTGLWMTIIAYRSNVDIDIQFEDGVIVEHKSYRNFLEGIIKHPNLHALTDRSRLGQKIITKQGFSAEIIEYYKHNNITIKLDTGLTLTNQNYDYIFIGHHSSHLQDFPILINDVKLEKLAYIKDIGNFYCTCTKCGHKDIWTIEEAKKHICE